MNLHGRQKINRQGGMSMLSWMALSSLVGIFLWSFIIIIPMYIDYYNVVSILDNMQNEAKLKGKPKPVIIDSFKKRLDISNVTNVTDDSYTIKKIKGRNSYLINLEYEVRKPLFGNISVVVSFQHTAEVGGAGSD